MQTLPDLNSKTNNSAECKPVVSALWEACTACPSSNWTQGKCSRAHHCICSGRIPRVAGQQLQALPAVSARVISPSLCAPIACQPRLVSLGLHTLFWEESTTGTFQVPKLINITPHKELTGYSSRMTPIPSYRNSSRFPICNFKNYLWGQYCTTLFCTKILINIH